LRWSVERRGGKEQEEECDPERSVAGARRVCDALLTHEEMAWMRFASRFGWRCDSITYA
jgi:hypothetical protein